MFTKPEKRKSPIARLEEVFKANPNKSLTLQQVLEQSGLSEANFKLALPMLTSLADRFQMNIVKIDNTFTYVPKTKK